VNRLSSELDTRIRKDASTKVKCENDQPFQKVTPVQTINLMAFGTALPVKENRPYKTMSERELLEETGYILGETVHDREEQRD
jgi:hypothetical protein